MIQIYNKDNVDYEKNGDMTLLPSSAIVHPVLNGSWSAELEHPIDQDGRWKYIQEEAVVKMPSFNGEQLFRIKSKEKSDSGILCEMEPIFFDSIGDCFLEDIRPTKKNGQEALNLMTGPNKKYSGKSNITKTATAYYEFKNLMEAINGDNENSFINRWGGEILFDNYCVIINERVGGDYGVELRYGKNIITDGLKEETDTRSVVTRIYPKAYNGYTMTDNGFVDSENINSYPTVKCATITFSDVKMETDAQGDDEENGVIICKTQAELDEALIQKCKEQYEAGLDKPKVSISANMVLLQNTDLYNEYKILEEVSLGDTVHCRNRRLDIVTDARVVELEYDSIQKKTTSVVLGDFGYNFFNNVSSAVNRIDRAIRQDGTVMAERIAGFINGAMASLKAQYNIAKKQDVLAILFENMEEENPMYGALAIGTQGVLISKNRTEDGKSWEWTTALTAGGLIANTIVAGILSDKLGKNYWNLDTGEFTLASDLINVDGKPLERIFSGNLINGYDLSETNLEKYWDTSGIITHGIADPRGGNDAIQIEPNSGDCYVSAKRSTNQVIHYPGDYTFSVWLRADVERTVLISFNRKTYACSLTAEWKKYTFSEKIELVQQNYQLFTIGGFGSIGTGSGNVYVYNPEAIFGYSSEDVFNMLTNNGVTQGIVMIDGKIYINGEYIQSLVVKADQIDVKELAAIGATIGGFTIESKRMRNTSGDGSKALYIGSYDWNNSDAMVIQALSNDAWKNLLMMKYDGSIASRNEEQTNEALLSAGALTFKGRPSSSGSWVSKMTFTPDGMKSPRNEYFMLSENADNYDTLTSGAEAGWEQNKFGNTLVYGTLEAKILKVTGSKSIIMQTEDYGSQQFYCHETPSPMLGDLGEGIIADDGICVVDIDDVFLESVNTEIKYYVFLQKEGEGDCWVSEKTDIYFVVRGTPGLKFNYEIKARQRGMESVRFNDPEDITALMLAEPDYESELYAEYEEELQNEKETEESYYAERDTVIKEMEEES